MQGTAGGQVEAVEVVERHVQHAREPAAGNADALVRFHRLDRRFFHPVAESQLGGKGGIAQLLIDDAGVGQYADVAVGKGVQLYMGVGQVIGRATLGDEQREHLAHRQAAFGQVAALVRQDLVDVIEVGAVPHPQAVGDAVHLAVPGRRRKRDAVQVVGDDAFARGQGLWALLVGTHAGGDHLANLLGSGNGTPERRVAVFLQLGGQGAAAGRLAVEVDNLAHLGQRGLGKAQPVHCRVGQGRFAVQQLAVLDEQQAVDQQRRNAGEVRVALLRIAELVEGQAAAVADVDAGLDLLAVRREQAVIDIADQFRGEACLLLHLIAALFQAFEHLRQGGVAQTAIERAVIGVANRLAGAIFKRVAERCGVAADFPGLEARGVHFMDNGSANDAGGHQENAPEQEAVLAARRFFRRNACPVERALRYLFPCCVGLPYCAHSPPAWPVTALACNLSRSLAGCMAQWRQNKRESMTGDNRVRLGHSRRANAQACIRGLRECRGHRPGPDRGPARAGPSGYPRPFGRKPMGDSGVFRP
ncbi:hypothetical protein D9M71_205310 [compost metagenome]